ncbi:MULTISPECIES: TonB-dependent receptor [unclassified Sphingobacterium]|uniref:TonB-dependent receptor n=1 Tax=unclassified Sphingobacterium TaxID=2609468 RepID=UPI0025E69E3C|nr:MULTISPECIES: TonB-dependent receptor [unclassified Sphingobacterium]
MSNFRAISTCTLLSFSSALFAQQYGVLQGQIKSSKDGSLLHSVSIKIKNTQLGTTSDASGNFQLPHIPFGKYKVLISTVGYASREVQIDISAIATKKLNIDLDPTAQQLGTAQVDGKSESTKLKETGFAVNAIETRQFANLNLDINQVLSRSLGVNIRESAGLGSDFKFSINGLSEKQVRFFIDGIPMENFGSGLTLNNIPVNLIERIEVFKGAVPAYLGSDALGGAVNIITNQSAGNMLDASLAYGSFNTMRAAVNGRFTDHKTGLSIQLGAFHNLSDNNYWMRNNPKNEAPIKVIENEKIIERDVKRFHDRYRSDMAQFEISLSDKAWADKISFGLTYSDFNKEIQTGATQNTVYGELRTVGNYIMPSFKYKKDNFLIEKLNMNAYASYGIDRYRVIDTASQSYGWGGGTGIPLAISGELNDIKTIYHYKNKSALIRTNFSYELDEFNALNLNYNFAHSSRSAEEQLGNAKSNPLGTPNTISKNILGLAYQNLTLDKRLSTSIFTKLYNLGIFARDVVYFSGSDGNGYTNKDNRFNKNYIGYGLASRFSLRQNLGIKASYERTYRLPESQEMFGDGINIIANNKLKPENSNNINAGLYLNQHFGRHSLNFESSYFLRYASDFIYFKPTGGKFSSYQNLDKTTINGLEAELKYQYANLLDFSINGTYQNSTNKSKYIDGQTANPDITYNDRVPNQPWLYGNLNLSIYKNNWLTPDTKLQFIWSSNYTHWYYLDWESVGSKESKNQIPTQFIHNAALSYSFAKDKYNISVECRNLTNELAYDNFRLQKPGRSFHVKLRYFLNSFNHN